MLAATYLVLSTFIGATAANILHTRSISTAGTLPAYALRMHSQQRAKYLVLMVLDGARPDYFGLTSLPHVDALRAEGTQFTNAIDGILEAETPAGHTTITTGSTPARDGILGFDWGQGDTGRYSLFDPTEMGNVEQIIKSSRAPTIAGLYKAAHPQARVIAVSGHKYYAAAPLGGPDADAIMYYQGDAQGRYIPVAVPGHTPPASVLDDPNMIYPTIHLRDGAEDTLATRLALRAIRTMHPRVVLINYPEFDWPLGHIDGGSTDPAAVVTDMRGFDQDLGMIEDAYRAAGILDKTLFVITADHGMMPITRFVPSTVITNAVSQAGTSAPDIATNSGDFVWLADQSKAQAVADNIVRARDPGIQSVYYLTGANGDLGYTAAAGLPVDSSVEAANQHLLGTLMNGHEPTVVVFGKEGVSFSDPSSHWKADHGGSSWQSQHIPLILAGPGIQQGIITAAPAELEDVAPTALTAMGVRPAGMGGMVLTDALDSSSGAALQARKVEQQKVGPVVAALSGQSNQDLGDR